MKKKIISIILILAVVVLPVTNVFASDGYFNTNENVSDTKVYEHSAFIAGSNVKANGEVKGIALVAGATVEANAKVEYGIMAGESVEVNSIVEKDVFLAGNKVKLGKDAVVGRDVYIAGNSVTINSNLNGNAFIGGSIVTLDNITINGDLNIAANQLDVIGDVNINGKLIVNDNIVINNENKLRYSSKELYKTRGFEFDFRNTVTDIILSTLTLVFTAIVLIMLFPKLFNKIDAKMEGRDFGKKLLYGLVTLIVVPIIGILSLAVMVGVTLSVIIFAFYIIAIILATIFAAYVIGDWVYTKLLKQKQNYVVSTSFAIIVFKILEYIPYIGWVIALLVFFYGLGIISDLFLKRNK